MIEIPAGGLKQLRKEAASRIIEKLGEGEEQLSKLISALRQVAETGDSSGGEISVHIEDITDCISTAEGEMRRAGID
jgi:hypothetical protein